MEPTTQPPDNTSSNECPYCAGEGLIHGNADDVVFEIDCACVGGNEVVVRWLLGKTLARDEQAK